MRIGLLTLACGVKQAASRSDAPAVGQDAVATIGDGSDNQDGISANVKFNPNSDGAPDITGNGDSDPGNLVDDETGRDPLDKTSTDLAVKNRNPQFESPHSSV